LLALTHQSKNEMALAGFAKAISQTTLTSSTISTSQQSQLLNP
jgi:hypothetical protein